MNKDAYYFPHFCNARHDRKVKRVTKQLGVEGYGIYFMLLEVLREQSDYRYPISDIDLLADEFGTSEAKVIAVVKNYELFTIDVNDMFFSENLIKNMQPYLRMKEQRSIAGKKSAEKRLQSFNDRSTTVQQSKVKESKVKEIKESKVYELESIQTRTKDFKDITNYKNCQLYEYNELNDEFKKLYTEIEWSAWKRFNKHLDDNCEYIRKIENQIKLKDYILIKKDFIDTKKITVNGFLDLLDTFNNYKPATDKYNSVYPALRGWLKNEIK